MKSFWSWYFCVVGAIAFLCSALAPARANAADSFVLPATPIHAHKGKAVERRRSARAFLARRGFAAARVAPATAILGTRPKAAVANLSAAWTALGPSQVETPAYGLVTGRVTSIAVDPADASGNTVYLGTTGGGVWKSIDAAGPIATVSFVPMTDGVPSILPSGVASLSIGAVTVQPGGTGVVLAGTGDPNDALDSYYGEGILRSADNGVTWTSISESDALGTSAASPHSFAGEGFAGFAWSTASPGLVVAAVTQAFDGVVVNAMAPNSFEGLYYSTDAGASSFLSTITDGPNRVVQSPATPASGYDGNAATAVVWDPVRGMFYAAVRYHGYYGSPDGVTWTRLANQPGLFMSHEQCPANPGQPGSPACPVFRGALAVQPVTGDLFAFTVDQNDLDQGIWQDVCSARNGSCSTGTTVTFGTQIADSTLEEGLGSSAIFQGDYNLWLAALPASSGTDTLLYAGTEDVFKCSLAENCAWQNTSNVDACAVASIAPSQHAVAVGTLAGPLIYFGNDSGLWRTSDGVQQQASCAADFDNLNGGLGSLSEITAVTEDPSRSGIELAAFGLNGAAATNASGNGPPVAWQQVLDGYAGGVAIDPSNPDDWYASGPGVSIYFCGSGGSCNNNLFPAGQTKAPLIGDPQTAGDGEVLPNPAVWMLDPQDHTKMIVGTCRIWRGSIAAGTANWTNANLLSPVLDLGDEPNCTGEGQIRSLAASGTVVTPSGPTTQEIIYAGMDGLYSGGGTADGHIFTAIADSSGSEMPIWIDLFDSPVVNGGLEGTQFNPQGFAVSSVVVDPHDSSGQTVYATIQGFSQSGASEPIVYFSQDQGQMWTNITANLPEVPVNALLVDPGNPNIVYLATDAGVYVTTSVFTCSVTLACWQSYGTDLPDAPVTTLSVAGGSGGLLRAGTYGRGIWQLPLLSHVPLDTISILPASLSFGSQQVGTASAPQSFTVINTGTVPLNIADPIQISTDADGTSDFAANDGCSTAVPAGGSCSVSVSFTPSGTGSLSAVLTLSGNIPGGQATVALTGTGTPPGQVELDPVTLVFPSTPVGVASAVEYITASNLGGSSVGLQSPLTGGDFQIVTGSSSPCGQSLAANTGCTIGIVFTPQSGGAASSVFTIVAGTTTLTANLTGMGTLPATDVLSGNTLLPGPALQFLPQVVGTVSAAQTIVMNNGGNAALYVSSVGVSQNFNVSASGCRTEVPGPGSCSIAVTFAPSAAGPLTGTLTIQDSLHNGVTALTVALSGTGLAAAGVPSVDAELDFHSAGVVNSPGSQPSTLLTLPITLTNNGNAALTDLHATIGGDAAGRASFSATLGTCGETLAPKASCSPSVTFAPTTTGPLTGLLTLSGNGLGAGLTTVLSGVGMEFTMSARATSPGASGTTDTVVAPASATYTVTLQPVGGSAGTLALACRLPQSPSLPAGSSCQLNGSGQLQAGQTQTVEVVVTTGPSSAATASLRWLTATVALAWAFPLLPFTGRRRRTARRGLPMARSVAVFCGSLLLLAVSGCGLTVNGGTKNGTSTGTGAVGVANSYQIVVTASGPGTYESTAMTLALEQ